MVNTFPDKRIKVLFLAGWYPNKDHPVSGIFIKRHAEAVSKYCDVAVLYVHDWSFKNPSTIDYAIEDGIKTIRVYPGSVPIKNRFFRYLFNIIINNLIISWYKGLKIVRKEWGRPELIHVNVCLPMGVLAVMLDFFYGIPFIVSEHYTGFLQRTKNPVLYMLLKIILHRSKKICPVSQALKNTMEQFYQADKYRVIPNVINTGFFIPPSSKKNQLRKKILHVSLLNDKQKNISGILHAIHEISKTRDDFELHIVGDGRDRAKLENLSIDLGLKDSVVFFHGFVDDLELLDFFQSSDFFVLNSNYETFSLVCTEALAAGIPVIATRCGGPEEYMNENFGILIEKGNQQQLVSAIQFMLDHSGNYDPWVLHEHIHKQFGYVVVGKELFTIYNSLLTKWRVGQGRGVIIIEPQWVVGDIGSGHNPHRRADLLIDREIGKTPHRSGGIALIPRDKSFILADVSKGIPLKNKVLDYSIASHIAEHVDNPDIFCLELSRISKRGYIETPGILSELLFDEPYHKWIVTKKGKELIFTKKKELSLFRNLRIRRFFYRIFYYGQSRFGYEILKYKNRIIDKFFLLLKYFLNKSWRLFPFTYTYYEWKNEIKYKIIK